jgi:E3 ubiquitin-protein ligase HERC2
MRRGLATVVPAQQLLSLFSWRELQMQITGRGVTREEMDLLEKMTDYRCVTFVARFSTLSHLLVLSANSGCNASDQHIKWFWQVMRDRFTDEERAMFLAFTW